MHTRDQRTGSLGAQRWAMGLLASGLFAATAAGQTPDLRLVEAVQRQDAVTARALILKKVDVNAAQGDGATALAWAAHWDDVETANLLIRAGASVNTANELGVTPLMLAASNGSGPMLGRLLEAGADPAAVRPSCETALMMAARSGSREAVQLLIDRKANVNAKTQRGLTALMWASAENHPDVVKLLLASGADIAARSAARIPPNRNYANRSDADVAKAPRPLLHENEARNPEYFRDSLRAKESPRAEGGFTPLLYGVVSGSIDVVQLLLAAGASVDELAPDGMSPVVLSLVKRHEPLALFLLERGANPNSAGTGYTALHVASITGQVEAAKALVARGANLNARLEKPVSFTEAFVTGTKVSPGAGWLDITGATPFMIAARGVNVPIMKILVDAGADPRLRADDGTTAIMLSSGLGKRADADIGYYTWDVARAIEAVELSLKLGIDVNASNTEGETALHAATYHAALPLIEVLLKSGAQIDALNAQKQTPLLIAQGHLICCTSFQRHTDAAALLLKRGADQSAGVRLNFGLGNYGDNQSGQAAKPSSER